MQYPLMPLATAVWLVDNSSLSFQQISEFCGLHEMEVQSIADGEVANNITAKNPILLKQLTAEDIKACEKDATKSLTLMQDEIPVSLKKTKKVKYIPLIKRRDKPNAVMWLIKHHPTIPSNEIAKLIVSTKKTVESIRNKTYANIKELQERDPVLLGLCSQGELQELIESFATKEETK